MRSLFKSVFSLSVSGTLLIILLFLLKPLFKDRISKRWQYYIWLVVIIRLLVPFTLPESPVNTLFQKADRASVQITDVSGEKETDEPHALPEREDARENHDSYGAKRETSKDVSAPASNNMAELFRYLWLVWLAGALLLLTRKIMAYRGFVHYIKTGCSEVSDVSLLNRLAQYGEDMGVKAPVELYVNSSVSSPLLTGFFRPCIVLPTADWPDSYLRYAILHELTHYRHRDMFYKWLVQVTLCLHWFNPFVHLMCREIIRACELACDEAIISRLGADGRKIYGDMLLNAVGSGGGYHNSAASLTLYENKKMIKERLGAIMNFKKKSFWVTLGSLALVVSLLAVSAAVGAYAAPAHSDEPFSEVNDDSTEDGQTEAGSGTVEADTTDTGSEDAVYMPKWMQPNTVILYDENLEYTVLAGGELSEEEIAANEDIARWGLEDHSEYMLAKPNTRAIYDNQGRFGGVKLGGGAEPVYMPQWMQPYTVISYDENLECTILEGGELSEEEIATRWDIALIGFENLEPDMLAEPNTKVTYDLHGVIQNVYYLMPGTTDDYRLSLPDF